MSQGITASFGKEAELSVSDRYSSHDYLLKNPTWDAEDSSWKVGLVEKIIKSNNLIPKSFCDIGCGAGGVLAKLRNIYPAAELFGYDVAPDVKKFWDRYESLNIKFHIGDFCDFADRTYDAVLLLDVIEHVSDPFAFLSKIRNKAKHYIFHMPLDLSSLTVMREKPLISQRENVGHINYFTKNIAICLLKECGFHVIDWQYSGAAFSSPKSTWKTALAAIPRRLVYAVNKDLGVRVLGGETLIVLAKDKV